MLNKNDKNANGQPDEIQDQLAGPPQAGQKGKPWKAKVDCTYGGRFVRQGEIVCAETMKNENFEAAT